MSDNALCLELLRRILPEKHIVSVKTQGQREIKGSLDSKGIRLDVLATDDKGRHYDIEMQVWDKFLGRRLRYYRAKIDEYSLLAGQSWRPISLFFRHLTNLAKNADYIDVLITIWIPEK